MVRVIFMPSASGVPRPGLLTSLESTEILAALRASATVPTALTFWVLPPAVTVTSLAVCMEKDRPAREMSKERDTETRLSGSDWFS